MGSPLLVMYGSQTGNSRMVAKEIGETAAKHGHAVRVIGMDEFKKVNWEEEPNLVCICSSTGNGDPPDNAEKFFRFCKKKTTPPVFAKTRFAVCALGDSNYEEFCLVGKEIDRHLARLGGTRFLKRCDVDEVDGIETHVEPWSARLFDALRALPPVESQPEVATGSPAVSPQPPPPPHTAPTVEGKGDEEEAAAEEEAVGRSAAAPLLARVTTARWLSSDTSATDPKRVLHVELDVREGGGWVSGFEPGDALGVLPANAPAEVLALLEHLGLDPSAPLEVGGAPPAHLRASTGAPLTCRDAFSTRLDIGSVSVWPPLPLLKLLHASLCAREALRPEIESAGDALLRTLVATAAAGGAQGRQAHARLQRERAPLLELLQRLECTPPVAQLVDCLPPLAPRYYSISNAASADEGKVHLCLSVVSYTTEGIDGRRCQRAGLASSMIARVCAPLLDGAKPAEPVMLSVYRREPSGNELRLPASPSTPVLMVGPGTGIAPFRSFLQQRRFKWSRGKLGPCHLFFGCRAEHVDFLYGAELRAMASSGALSLHTAFSRSREACSAGTWRGVRLNIPYVQDLIEEQASTVANLLFTQASGGHFYVCGDGQSMANDVHEALCRVTAAQLSISLSEAEERLKSLAAEGRYCREIWN
ncbi:hypothetical protein AB1Y20_018845 [Prymnesium parvum]|uniref:Methionine synthase reductase n=1 Tax=Prymnesium parvum TaxID=97485 RepID=A0AB34JTM8_PRYPA